MSPASKIHSLTELAERLEALRSSSGDRDNVRVVHCHGVFDLLHIGHIRYLQKAARLGDVLVVTVTPDRFVNKGPHRPAFHERLRVEALAALDCVDFVALNEQPIASAAIRALRPDVYAKGAEFRDRKTPELLQEEQVAAEVAARVEFIEEVTSSSSQLLNKYLSPFDEATEEYLQELRQRFTLDDILTQIERFASLKVLVVGEAIIDEYYSCSAIGQSAKAPIVAARYLSHERYAGGAVAVANHLAPFCHQVDLLTMLGENDSHEVWLREQLRPSVGFRFFTKRDSPTIIKRRYRESYFGVPLFAINFLSEQPLSDAEESALVALMDDVADYDLVIVTDYGHEMLAPPAVRRLCDTARFLAVNTQANAANSGFHTVSKYPRADFVSLAERELQLECRRRSGSLNDMLVEVGQRLYAGSLVVTLGSRGCLGYHRRTGHHRAPSLATRIVDRVGAGDAFFCIASLCAAVDAPTELLAFLGNVAGAEAVAVVGNSRTLEPLAMRRHIESLFK
jgi:rfaE bifunctional protein nucleotidyltransferase chain/domain